MSAYDEERGYVRQAVSGDTDRLARMEANALDYLTDDLYEDGREHAREVTDGAAPDLICARDVLALVEIARAARALIQDADEVMAEDMTLHALQQKLGAIFLGYGGARNHEDELRDALSALDGDG